jgi:adenylate cyclase
VTSLATRFYESGSSALLEYGGLLGQIAGDEVMALFVPGLATDAYRSKAVQAGRALLKALGYGSPERPGLRPASASRAARSSSET